MEPSEQFEVRIPSYLAKGQQLQQRILDSLVRLGYSGRELFGIRLALEEAIINAIRHGNRLDPLKDVRVKCELSPTFVRIEIEDEGPGFNPDRVPDPVASENLDRASGRGIMLIRAYMTSVQYLGRGNILILEKRRSTVEFAPVSHARQVANEKI